MTRDRLTDLDAALEGRYRVERELGQGGMASVYLAQDLRHHRPVALKMLRPELTGVLGAERFLREIQTVAALNHPHILPLFDSFRAGDHLLYVMPLVTGESLRDRLTREGRLPVSDAVEIARQVATALDYAHSQGVVHRDIKPENILLQAGQAIVSDFGIARAVDAAALGSGERLTGTGLVIGTPPYMSPEQVAGGDITHRSDLYSLGCVLYEMLTGAPPFTGPSAQAVLGAHATRAVPPIRKQRPEVSGALEATVLTALAKEPGDRFPSGAQMAEVLAGNAPAPRRPVSRARLARASGLAVVLGAVALLAWWGGQRDASSAGRSVAVLYLDNRSGDSTVQFLADGITEEMILRLGQVERLRVPSRGAVRRFRGKPVDDPGAIGSALGVSHFVSGTIDRGGAGVRIRVDLVDAASGSQLWGSSFMLEANGDLFAVEDSIARAVAGGVIGRLGADETRLLAQRRTRNPDAYEHYLRGNFYLSRRTGEPDGRMAMKEYEAALELDPAFAEAHARLGLVYGIYASWPWPFPGLTTDSLISRGMAAADRAIALDSTVADAWLTRGFLLTPAPADEDAWAGFRAATSLPAGIQGRCWSGAADCQASAVAALGRAVRLAPRSAEAWYQLGRAQGSVAGDSAIARSLALEPDRAVSAWLLGMRLLFRREFAGAELMLDSAVALGRRDLSVYAVRFDARLAQNDTGGARDDLDSYAERMGTDRVGQAFHASSLVAVDALTGKTSDARRRADSLARAHPIDATQSRPILTIVAAALVMAGDPERGLAALDRAVAPAGPAFWANLSSVRWDGVRGDPRFRQIAQRLP